MNQAIDLLEQTTKAFIEKVNKQAGDAKSPSSTPKDARKVFSICRLLR